MLNDSAHNELQELIPAYALGCLDKEDAYEVRQHLLVCAVCREELTTYESVVDSLGAAVPLVSEPAALKERLLDHLQEEAPSTPTITSRWLSWWKTVTARPAVAFAACAVFVVAVFIGWQLIRSGPMQFVMTPTEVAPQAAGVISLTAEQEGILTITDLPPLAADRQYQLWLVYEGKHDTGAIFSVDAEGAATVLVNGQRPLTEYERFGITIEPAGGSEGPTGDRVLAYVP